MNKLFNIILIVAALAILVWAGVRLFPNEEKIIRKKLTQLAQSASVKPGQNMIVRAANVNRLREYFSPDVAVEIEEWGRKMVSLHGRNELMSLVTAVQPHLREARLKLVDLQVTLGESPGQATALMTVLGDINGERYAVSQVLQMELRKFEGEWLITRVQTVRILE